MKSRYLLLAHSFKQWAEKALSTRWGQNSPDWIKRIKYTKQKENAPMALLPNNCLAHTFPGCLARLKRICTRGVLSGMELTGHIQTQT